MLYTLEVAERYLRCKGALFMSLQELQSVRVMNSRPWIEGMSDLLWCEPERPSVSAAFRQTFGQLAAGTLATLECLPYAAYPGGAHTIVVGRIVDVQVADNSVSPLLYFRSRLLNIGPKSRV